MADRKTLFLLVLATSLMGSSFAVVQMGIRYAPPLYLAGLRFSLAGLILAFGIRRRGRPRDWQSWARVITIGLLQTTGVMGATFLSLQTITAGESAILTFANPMLVVVFSAFFLALPGFVWVAHKSLMTDAPPDRGQASRNERESRCDTG